MRNSSTSKINPKQIVAYFDFDGTITSCDTLLPFLIYTVGYIKFLLKIPTLIPILIMYWTNVITNETAKERTLTALLKDKSFEYLDAKAESFARRKLSCFIKPEIYTKLEYHMEHGHTVILVSANLALYLNHWAKIHKLDGVIGTELEFVNGKFIGRLKTRNCYGRQKIMRIAAYLDGLDKPYEYSYGYGNSRGDYELLIYVNEGYWVKKADIMSWADYRGNKRK